MLSILIMSTLLISILAALSTTGCVVKDTNMCVDIPDDAETCPAPEDVDLDAMYSAECDLGAREVTGEGTLTTNDWDTGDENLVCCYPTRARDTQPTSSCIVGRPCLEASTPIRAPLHNNSSWCAPPATGGRLDAEAAECWRTLGQLEHASIAAFARLTLELMATGAPAALLAEVQQAGADEVEHARLCFSIAARLSGEVRSPGPLPLSEPIVLTGDLVALASAAAREGCLGETLSAALAVESARRATDPEIRSALERITADETRHAALSWRIVARTIEAGGAPVRAAVEAALSDPVAMGPSAPKDRMVGEGLGLLGPEASRAVYEQAWAAVIEPSRAALLAA